MPRPSSRRRIRIASQRFGANNPYTIVRVRRTSVDRQSYTPLPPLYPLLLAQRRPLAIRRCLSLPLANDCQIAAFYPGHGSRQSVLGHSAPRMLTAALAVVWHENSISRTRFDCCARHPQIFGSRASPDLDRCFRSPAPYDAPVGASTHASLASRPRQWELKRTFGSAAIGPGVGIIFAQKYDDIDACLPSRTLHQNTRVRHLAGNREFYLKLSPGI